LSPRRTDRRKGKRGKRDRGGMLPLGVCFILAFVYQVGFRQPYLLLPSVGCRDSSNCMPNAPTGSLSLVPSMSSPSVAVHLCSVSFLVILHYRIFAFFSARPVVSWSMLVHQKLPAAQWHLVHALLPCLFRLHPFPFHVLCVRSRTSTISVHQPGLGSKMRRVTG
jgi:hypothetical protein